MGGNIEFFEFADGIQSLVAPFLNVRCVLVESEFIVQSESKVFKAVNCFYCVIVDDSGGLGRWVTYSYFFCFGYIEMEEVMCAPLGEVGDSVVVI